MAYSQIVGIPGAPGATGVNESPQDSGIALLGATTAAMNLWVDPVAGADTNPGTAALPFRTIAAALVTVPRQIRHFVTINLTNGDYAEPLEILRFSFEDGVLFLQGNLLKVPTEPRRTATIWSGTTIGTALAGWVVNAHEDKWVQIVAGTGIGQIAKVVSNTADTLTVFPSNTTWTPNGTSEYEIYTSGARITGVITVPASNSEAVRIRATLGNRYEGIVLYGLDIVNGETHIEGGGQFRLMVVFSAGR